MVDDGPGRLALDPRCAVLDGKTQSNCTFFQAGGSTGLGCLFATEVGFFLEQGAAKESLID